MPDRVKGRVLYVGASYYNNWYLSRELRRLGWQADLLTYAAENAELHLHGSDFSLKDYLVWDRKYPEPLFSFLVELLRQYAQTDGVGRQTAGQSGRGEPWKLLRLLVGLLRCQRPRRLAALARLVAERKVGIRQLGRLGTSVPASLLGSGGAWPLRNVMEVFLDSARQWEPSELAPLRDALKRYDILHFAGVFNLRYFYFFNPYLFGSMPIGWDIRLLRHLGKKIVYSNAGCLDGVSQSSFRQWSPEPVCDICRWRDVPEVCSDERNLAWGELRNSLTDYQITIGGNRRDYNDDPRVHEVPEFYCLDTRVWDPELPVPDRYQLPYPKETVKVFHAVGNYDLRSDAESRNIKCTHIYVPTIERLKSEGHDVEMIFFSNVPNKDLRYYQVQADIFVDMLTFGFFGATAREGMMLGKPVVCFLRPEWLESMRREVPEYVDELPVVSATPDTVYDVLKDLIEHPEKRREIGRRSREFAVKWHSAEAGARRMDRIYSDLLRPGKPLV